MTPEEWARTLALSEPGERSTALLMLSDEDWLADDHRDWLRSVSGTLHPACSTWNGHYWTDRRKVQGENEERSALPPLLIDKIGRVACDDEPSTAGEYTRYRDDVARIWLDLLEVLGR